jgi:hypothetical protein
MTAGSIIVDLLMRTASFETDTKRAEKRLADMRKEAERIGKGIGVAMAAVGVAAVALVKNSIDAADATGKLAQQTGTTVEELSALTYAASLADVSQEELAAGLVKLTRTMSEAEAGNKDAAASFDALGIKLRNTDGSLKSSDQVLREIASRFASMPDGIEKTNAAVELFGRSGAQLIPLLNGGASGMQAMREEAERLGVVISTDTAKAAEEFNDNITRVTAAITGLANRATADLLPSLGAVSEELVALAKSEETVAVATALIRGAIDTAIVLFQTLAVVGSDVGFVFLGVGREIGAWIAQIEAAARGDWQGFKAISEAVKADGERAREELDKFQARIMAIGRTRVPERPTLADNPFLAVDASGGGSAPAGGRPGKPAKQSEAERYLEGLQKQSEKVRELSVLEQALADIQGRRIEGLTPKLRDQILAQAALVDQQKRAAGMLDAQKKQEEERLEFIRKAAEEEAAIRRSVSESMRAQAEARMAEIAGLIEGNESLRDEIAVLQGGVEARRAIERARISSTIALKEETRAMLQNAGGSEAQIQALEQEIALLRERAGLLDKRVLAETDKEVRDAAAESRKTLADQIERGILEGSREGLDLMEIFEAELKAHFAKTVLRPVIEPVADALTKVIEEFVKAIVLGGRSSSSGGGGLAGLFGSLFGSSGGAGGTVATDDALALFFHRGGIAGYDGDVRRYHSGGLVHGEVPLIAQAGEEILRRDDPRHRWNMTARRDGPALVAAAAPIFNFEIVNNAPNVRPRVERREDGGARVIIDQIKGELAEDMRNGGEFASAMESNMGARRAPSLMR